MIDFEIGMVVGFILAIVSMLFLCKILGCTKDD